MKYSQFGQDKFVYKHFREKKDGYFVDVGAFNDGNDTKFLESEGWSGICIEPITGAYLELIKNRKCTCVNACVGNNNQDVDFRENIPSDSSLGWNTYTSMLSGVAKTHSNDHLARIDHENMRTGGKSVIVKKKMMTLTKIFEENNAPDHIDYLKIDTEGGELSCLLGIDFSRYSFGILSVEANYREEIIPCAALLINKNYRPFVKVGDDIFFVQDPDVLVKMAAYGVNAMFRSPNDGFPAMHQVNCVREIVDGGKTDDDVQYASGEWAMIDAPEEES